MDEGNPTSQTSQFTDELHGKDSTLVTHSTRIALALFSVLAILVVAPTASAGPLVASAPDCDAQSLSQPFLRWADVANYTLNPGGAFEDGAANWLLSGSSVVSGNESFNVTSADDSKSLSIPLGASAVSAPICVGIEHPDLRFFAKASNPNASLRVDVIFETASGDVLTAPVGAATGTPNWALTAPMPVVANLLALMPGDHTAVAFRFSAYGGSFRIDDVYVDPYSRN
jgi:hypothetical protein